MRRNRDGEFHAQLRACGSARQLPPSARSPRAPPRDFDRETAADDVNSWGRSARRRSNGGTAAVGSPPRIRADLGTRRTSSAERPGAAEAEPSPRPGSRPAPTAVSADPSAAPFPRGSAPSRRSPALCRPCRSSSAERSPLRPGAARRGGPAARRRGAVTAALPMAVPPPVGGQRHVRGCGCGRLPFPGESGWGRRGRLRALGAGCRPGWNERRLRGVALSVNVNTLSGASDRGDPSWHSSGCGEGREGHPTCRLASCGPLPNTELRCRGLQGEVHF